MGNRLLVVEDSPVQAELLCDDLTAAGYDVSLATDGEAALDRLAEMDRPDAVITDVMMPGMDGYELCRRVKGVRELGNLPVILLTSLRDPVDIVRGLECGADNFITKPYEIDQLLHRLETVLRSQDLRLAGRFRMGVEVLVLGHTFTVSAERQQILDMLMSSFEELVNTNDRLREREEQLQSTRVALEDQIALTEHRHAELRDSRNALRHILDEARVATWKVDLNTEQFEWSPNAHELLHLPPGASIDTVEGFLGSVMDEDSRVLGDMVDALLHGDPDALPEDWEFRVVGRDGAVRAFSSRGQATTGADHVSVSGIMIDVTRRRSLEEQLQAREQMLSGVLSASPDGIVVTGIDGTIQFASDGIRDVIGLGSDELVGRHPFDYVDPAGHQAMTELARGLLHRPAGAGQTRVGLRHARGHVVTADCRIRPLADGNGGAPTGFVTVVRDVTEQAGLEAALEQARDQAEAANQAKSDYLSRMSHELRTPMNSVLGFAQLLELSELDPADRDGVDRILTAGRHLLNLIDDVLDIARIEAGRLTISLEPVAVHGLVTAAVDLMQPQLDDGGLSLSTDVDERTQVVADQQRLSQVLINLVSNAAKYNRPNGEIHVSCSSRGDGWCRLAVSDTGLGIPDDVRPQLFGAFERLGADQTDVAGTGLGLALSKTLVEAMGGAIGCDSVVGQGSTFWVDLPLAGERERPATTPQAVPEASLSASRSATILYVEDNPLNVELVQRALASRPGMQLHHAGSGDVGLRMARELQPDVVLLDLQLPGMSGHAVLERLRADASTATVPVVVVSADATTATAHAVEVAGADAYLTKPLDLAELYTTIDDILLAAEPSSNGDTDAAGGHGPGH